MRRRLLLGGMYLVWLLVPLAAFGNGWSAGGGLDGPCIGASDFNMRQPAGAEITQTPVAPLSFGSRCTADGPGDYHAEQVFPDTQTWVLVGGLLLLPFLLLVGTRTVRSLSLRPQ